MRSIFIFTVTVGITACLPVWQTRLAIADDTTATADAPKTGKQWMPLTGKWESSNYGGDGPVEITDKLISLGFGDPLSGVTWTGDYPKDNYEMELDVRRVDGFDFMAAITFPVADQHCSLVLGGWGGSVTGISNIDGQDASTNNWSTFKRYKNQQWYTVRIRVTPQMITAWIDDSIIVETRREGHKFDIRMEMDPALPLGVANFQCESELRNIRLRKLDGKQDQGDS